MEDSIKVLVDVLYKNGYSEEIVTEMTAKEVETCQDKVGACFKHDTYGMIALPSISKGDSAESISIIRLSEVSRIKLTIMKE